MDTKQILEDLKRYKHTGFPIPADTVDALIDHYFELRRLEIDCISTTNP